MRTKKILYAALFIAALSTLPAIKTYAAETSMPIGTVVIGAKAFDLTYANDPKNQTEISAEIIAGGTVYVKNFNGVWVDNDSSKTINASIIPSVTYKSETGIESNYTAGDANSGTPVDTTPLTVISIE